MKIYTTFINFVLIYLGSFTLFSNSSENDENKLPQIPGLNLEQILNEIGGGLEKETDSSVDELVQPEYSDQEVEEIRKNDPYLEAVRNNVNKFQEERKKNKMFDDIAKVSTDIFIHTNRQREFDLVVEEEILPAFSEANDVFYDLLHLSKEIGIVTEEFQEMVIDLIKKAKETFDLIHSSWKTYQEFVSSKLLPPLAELEKALQDISERKSEYLKEREYTEIELKEIQKKMDKAKSNLKTCLKNEAKLKKMLNTFLKEEKNLIRLGISVWPDSQAEALEDEDEDEDSNEPSVNEYNRQFITRMNLRRASTPNDTKVNINKKSKESEEPKLKKSKIKEEL